MNVSKFTANLSAFVKKAKGNSHQVVRKVVIDIGTRIVMRSPVGDPSGWQNPENAPPGYVGGRFRGNWQYGEATVPSGTLPDIDASGQTSITRINGIQAEAAGKLHYLTNNLPYAIPLEYGWSKQAPSGMVGLTVVEYQQIVQKAAAEVRK